MSGIPAPEAIRVHLIDALAGFFRAHRRSGVLDGSMLQRATYCVPFDEGTSAGVHLSPGETFVLRREGDECWPQFTDETHERVTAAHGQALPALVAKGVLQPESHWAERLSQGWYWSVGRRLSVWTGFFARVPSQSWLRLGGAFTRRARLPVSERILVGEDSFVPLVLEVDLSSDSTASELWVDEGIETLSLLPLRPSVSITEATLEDAPAAGEQYNAFFDPSYLEKRGRKGGIGRYRKLVRDDPASVPPPSADCRFIYMGPRVHRFARFESFASSQGLTSAPPRGEDLMMVELREPWGVRGIFDGDVLRDMDIDVDPEAQRQVVECWRSLYGALSPFAEELVLRFLHYAEPGEAFMMLNHWAFMMTPPGWSTIVEAAHFPRLDGLRGVIATDRFHALSGAFRMREGEFAVPRGAPLTRSIPIPRTHVHPTLEVTALDDWVAG